MIKKRVLAMIVSAAFVFTFAACGDKTQQDKGISAGVEVTGSQDTGSGTKDATQNSQEQEATPAAQETTAAAPENTATSIAGLQLGDPADKVIEKLGKAANENTFEDEGGFIGETYYLWEYSQGVEALIGSESNKLLGITVTSTEFQTNLGVKAGDKASDVLEKYRAKYTEFQGANSDGKLTGWFAVENGMLIIFDFDKSDGTRINENVGPDSKVESIELAYARHFD